MAVWLMTIVGIVSVGVLLDIIIPEGEINKYIRGIFGIVVVLVVISPLPKLINSDWDLDKLLGNSINIDKGYVDEVNQDKLVKLERSTAATLAKNYPVSRVRIFYEVNSNKIDTIKVYLDKNRAGEGWQGYSTEIKKSLKFIVNQPEFILRVYCD